MSYNVIKFGPKGHINSWRMARRTSKKKAGLRGFRFHDLRYRVIPSLAESGVSKSTFMAIANHASRKKCRSGKPRPLYCGPPVLLLEGVSFPRATFKVTGLLLAVHRP
jgi:hypothetical protein